MPRTFFDLNVLANMVAKLDNIVGEHVKLDMFANNVGQFGHTLTLGIVGCSKYNQRTIRYFQIFKIPSNSAPPTPTMIRDIGRSAAYDETRK